ncbi:MAG TPA: ABC transporter permease [Gemmataceae bacterium]
MASRTKPEEAAAEPAKRQIYAEFSPSEMRGEEPTFARTVGFTGMVFAILGGMFVFVNLVRGRPTPTWTVVAFGLGLALMLYHAARDGDQQVRRTYGAFGVLWLLLAGLFAVIPGGPERVTGHYFLPYGAFSLLAGLLFLMPFARHETDATWRGWVLAGIAAVGAALSAGSFVAGIVHPPFMVGPGIVLNLLGLAFLSVYVGEARAAEGRGFQVAVGMGILGAAVILYVLGRTIIPDVFGMTGVRPFLVPTGLLLLGAGLLHAAVSVGFWSENDLVVMTRRELASYFYSPIAYLVMLGFAVVGWFNYWYFVSVLAQSTLRFGGMDEPIVEAFILQWWPVISIIFVVPAVTMRLFSEEKRTGTLEMLLTAPVSEWSVVLGKFLAAWVFFLLLWVPWGLYLIALRVEGGSPFDYLPLLSFFLVLAVSGASFVALGLFFSSLTRNQIIAAVLTFGVLLAYVLFFFLPRFEGVGEFWRAVFTRLSFINLWLEALSGRLMIRDVVLHLSLAFFWLFLTVKVLESRKWK